MYLERLRKDFPVLGLGLFMLVAGASKFFLLEYWMGYEPKIILNLVPLAAEQITQIGGVFELILGIGLLTRRKTEYLSGLSACWMVLITLQVTRLGIWDLAIRDLGITLYAVTVYLIEKEKTRES